jgi:hypothetical protein
MVRYVAYPHPPVVTAEMEEWEAMYRNLVGYVLALGSDEEKVSALLRGFDEDDPSAAHLSRVDDPHQDEPWGGQVADDQGEGNGDRLVEPLGVWMREQRNLYARGMLPPYRADLLVRLSLHRRVLTGRSKPCQPQYYPDPPSPPRQLLLLGEFHPPPAPPFTSAPMVSPDASSHRRLEREDETTMAAQPSDFQYGDDHGSIGPADSNTGTYDTESSSPNLNPLDAAWMEKYRLLCEYRQCHGNCRVPRRDPVLGLWVGNQRMILKNGTMRNDRRELLEKIGFEAADTRYAWTSARNTDKLETAWRGMYDALVQYRSEFGSVDVPKSYVIRGNSNSRGGGGGATKGKSLALGRWVSRQRVSYAQGVLREDRVRLLDDIGFVWSVPVKKMLENSELEPLDFRHLQDETSIASSSDISRRDGHDIDCWSCASFGSGRGEPKQRMARSRFFRRSDATSPASPDHLPPEYIVFTHRTKRSRLC